MTTEQTPESATPERARLPRAVVVLAFVSLLNEVSAQMVAPLIPVLMATTLAAGPTAIGLVDGAADAVAAFVKLWAGRHADERPDQRNAMVMLGYGLALAARPLIGLAGHWFTVVALRSTDRLGKGLRGAPRDAMLADATPNETQGRAFGLNRGMDYAGAVIGALIAAAVLAWGGLAIEQVIGLSVLPGIAVLILLASLPRSAAPDASTAPHPPAPARLLWAGLSPTLRAVLPIVAIAGLGRASEAFIILRGHELGLSTVHILLQWAWLAAVQSGVALLAAAWTDRVSKRWLVPVQWGGLAIGYAALAFASGPLGLWLAVSLYGVLSGIGEGLERAMVSELADPAQKGTAFGWYYLLTGLSAIPAGLLFGGVWKWAGSAVAFSMAAAVTLGCAAWFGVVDRRST
jgi:MFS family permease